MSRIPATRSGTRPRIALLVSLGVLVWSVVQATRLALDHTVGAEVYGVLVAVLAVGAGILTVALLWTPTRRTSATGAVLVLWAIVALGGVAGSLAHMIGPVAGHGPVDLRPRPIAAPLIFTVLGLIGGTALLVGRRAAVARSAGDELREEVLR